MDDNSIDHGFQCSDPISCLLLLGCLDPTTIHRRDTSSCKSLCLWPGRCQKWSTQKMRDAMHVDWSSTYNKFHTWTDSPFPCSNNPQPSIVSCEPKVSKQHQLHAMVTPPFYEMQSSHCNAWAGVLKDFLRFLVDIGNHMKQSHEGGEWNGTLHTNMRGIVSNDCVPCFQTWMHSDPEHLHHFTAWWSHRNKSQQQA